MITIDDVKAMRLKMISWNGGIMQEYFKPIRGGGLAFHDVRLSVWFGEHPDHPFKVYLTMPQSKVYLEHVDTPERFKQFYNLMTGKVMR